MVNAGRSRARDHPRLRGEQPYPCSRISGILGSPPLARGTDYTIMLIYNNSRITPACAGNRDFFFKVLCVIWDHPRLRGEQY